MGSTFIVNITKGFLENKVETLVYISLILDAIQNTEVEKI